LFLRAPARGSIEAFVCLKSHANAPSFCAHLRAALLKPLNFEHLNLFFQGFCAHLRAALLKRVGVVFVGFLFDRVSARTCARLY
jgi:hypothetical protein